MSERALKAAVLLPTNVTPKRYEVCLDIAKAGSELTLPYDGHVKVDLDIHLPTTTITCHANALTIHSAAITADGGAQQVPSNISLDAAKQTATFTFSNEIPAGSAKLRISFTGTCDDSLAGLYRSSYETPSGAKKFAAITQFEATDARKAFPCWDEPALKAVFSVTVVAPSDEVVISNTIASSVVTSADGRTKTWSFADTPKMSTYLVGIFVGQFDTVSASVNGVVTTIYTPPGKAHTGRFALDIACRGLAYYEKMLGVPFPLPKNDLIAVSSLAAAAMENWGCISFRFAYLLVEDGITTYNQRRVVAQVVLHELAHAWFGNLVTMKWWDDLWLNEGWATFVEDQATDALEPSFNILDKFQAKVASTAFELAALKHTHPVETPISHPDEINEFFDAVSYDVGASINRMLFDYLTPPIAFRGVATYLARHKYGNTVSTDLWAALEEVSGRPVARLMHNYVKKCGFPYLHVSLRGRPVVAGELGTDAEASMLEPGRATVTRPLTALPPGIALELRSERFIAPWAMYDDAWPPVDGGNPMPTVPVDPLGGLTAAGTTSAPCIVSAQALAAQLAAAHGGVVAPSSGESGTAKATDIDPATLTNDWTLPFSVVVGRLAGGTNDTHLTPVEVRLGDIGLDDPAVIAGGVQARSAALSEAAAKLAGALQPASGDAGAVWFKLNARHAAFYRTVYSSELLLRLLPALTTTWRSGAAATAPPSTAAGAPAGMNVAVTSAAGAAAAGFAAMPGGGNASTVSTAGGNRIIIIPPLLSTCDRIGLVNDVAAAAGAGLCGTGDLLRVLWACRHETDLEVWSTVASALQSLRLVATAAGEEYRTQVDNFIRALVGPSISRLGWDPLPDDGPQTRPLRAVLLQQAAQAGEHPVIAEALRRFYAHAKAVLGPDAGLHGGAAGSAAAGTTTGHVMPATPTSIHAAGGADATQPHGTVHPDLRGMVLRTAAGHGGHPAYEKLLQLYRHSKDADEQRSILAALAEAGDKALVRRTLDWALTDEVPSQDVETAIEAAGAHGHPLAWEWTKEKWDVLFERFGKGNFLLSYIVGGAASVHFTQAAHDDVKAFFATHPAPGAERRVQQCLEGIRWAAWRVAILRTEPHSLLGAVSSLLQDATTTT